jgi:hypothetical protein
VLFVAGLFVATFERLSNRPTGFSADRLLTLETVAKPTQSPVVWDQMAEHLRAVPGVETVALASWPLLGGEFEGGYISINGAPSSKALAAFLYVSPGWTEAMRIPVIDGRDFLPSEMYPGFALVNQTFAKEYFHGESPVGKSFERVSPDGKRLPFQVVGLVGDACYDDVREPIWPQAYFPFRWVDAKGNLRPMETGTFIVCTSSMALASFLRREVQRARPEFRVSNISTQWRSTSRTASASGCWQDSHSSLEWWRSCWRASASTGCLITPYCSDVARSRSAWRWARKPVTWRCA